jgi:cytochrome c biogenesis factor
MNIVDDAYSTFQVSAVLLFSVNICNTVLLQFPYAVNDDSVTLKHQLKVAITYEAGATWARHRGSFEVHLFFFSAWTTIEDWDHHTVCLFYLRDDLHIM